jgi:hypothetical protein
MGNEWVRSRNAKPGFDFDRHTTVALAQHGKGIFRKGIPALCGLAVKYAEPLSRPESLSKEGVHCVGVKSGQREKEHSTPAQSAATRQSLSSPAPA